MCTGHRGDEEISGWCQKYKSALKCTEMKRRNATHDEIALP